jgi:hypothetical protein
MDKKSENRFSPAVCITTKTISQMTLSLTHSRGIHTFFSTTSISPSPWRHIRQSSMPFQGHIPLQQILLHLRPTPPLAQSTHCHQNCYHPSSLRLKQGKGQDESPTPPPPQLGLRHAIQHLSIPHRTQHRHFPTPRPHSRRH